MKAYAKNIRISPKKLRVVAEVVRGMKAGEALDFLKFAPKKGAGLLHKVVNSAVQNAVHNDNQKDQYQEGECIQFWKELQILD